MNYKNYAFVIAILLYAFFIFFSLSWVNQDATLYLYQADQLKNGSSFNDLYQVYSWPFYSYIIYFISNFFSLSFILSAKLINLIAFLFFLFFSFKILESLKVKDEFYFYFIFFIFGSSITEYFPYIIRDQIYWTLIIGTFYFFIQYEKSHEKIYLYKSLILIFISIFFRPESLLLFLLVICYLFYTYKKLLVFFLFVGTFLFLINYYSIGRLGDLFFYLNLFFNNINSSNYITSLNNYFLNDLLVKYDLYFLIPGLFLIFLKKQFFGIYFLFLLPIVYFFINHKIKYVKFRYSILLIFTFISLAALLNLFANFVLTSRYLVVNYILIIFLTLFILNKFISSSLYKYLLLLLFILSTIFNMTSIANKSDYEYEMIKYLNNQNIQKHNVLMNNNRLNIYFGKKFTLVKKDKLIVNEKDFMDEAISMKYNYVVYSHKHNNDKYFDVNGYDEIHSIKNKKGTTIVSLFMKAQDFD